MFGWKCIRRCLLVLVWTATLIALFYGEENWRGARAWNKYRQTLEARGEQLDLRTFIPKSIPDEENFAATPLVKAWFPRGETMSGSNYFRAEKMLGSRTTNGARQYLDLAAWKMAFAAAQSPTNGGGKEKFKSEKVDRDSRAQAAPAVLKALSLGEPDLPALRLAAQRPRSRYPVNYDMENPWGILLPHLGKLKGACMQLLLNACAQLAAGQTEGAFEDVKLMFYLADSVKDEPFLISHLVRMACMQLATQPIWEGLADHRWSEVQLSELQKRMRAFDFFADLKRPLKSERAAAVLTAELLNRHKYSLDDLSGPPIDAPPWAGAIGRMIPHGWYHLEQINYCRLFDAQLEGTFDASQKRVSPSKVQLQGRELESNLAGSAGANHLTGAVLVQHRLLAALLLPALGTVSRKIAIAQTATDEALLACALERYRLVNNAFPENLAALVPQFAAALPHDVINGEPFKYRRTPEGQFVLYSIGWDEKDDGGTPGKTLFDEKQGDWVWTYPAK